MSHTDRRPAERRSRVAAPGRALRLGFRVLGQVAPGLAGRLAFRLFGTPRRRPLSADDERFLATGQRLRVAHEPMALTGYSWGQGPAVVLVHGWESHAGSMRAFVQPLVRQGFRAVAFDAPAHGASPGKRTNVLEMGAAIEATMRQVGPVYGLIAHSLGAAATLMLLARSTLPVERVVVMGAPARLEDLIALFAQALDLPAPVVAGMRRYIEQRFGRPVASFSSERAAASLTVPGLVIHDRRDVVVPFADAEAIAAAWPAAALLATERLGHRGALQDPEVIAAVVEFLSGQTSDSDLSTAKHERVPAR